MVRYGNLFLNTGRFSYILFFFFFLNCILKQANPNFKLRKPKHFREICIVSESTKMVIYVLLCCFLQLLAWPSNCQSRWRIILSLSSGVRTIM